MPRRSQRSRQNATTAILAFATVLLFALAGVIAIRSEVFRAEKQSEEWEFVRDQWEQTGNEPQRQVDEARSKGGLQEAKTGGADWFKDWAVGESEPL